jgi:hypothetical protein
VEGVDGVMSTFKPLVGILGDVDGRIVPGPTSFVLDECPHSRRSGY